MTDRAPHTIDYDWTPEDMAKALNGPARTPSFTCAHTTTRRRPPTRPPSLLGRALPALMALAALGALWALLDFLL